MKTIDKTIPIGTIEDHVIADYEKEFAEFLHSPDDPGDIDLPEDDIKDLF